MFARSIIRFGQNLSNISKPVNLKIQPYQYGQNFRIPRQSVCQASVNWSASIKSNSCNDKTIDRPAFIQNRTIMQASNDRYNLPLSISKSLLLKTQSLPVALSFRCFHAARSKTKYLDFRYRIRPNIVRTHLLIIRRQKMKKHRRRKWRKKFKCLLAKRRLKREISKEKMFRVELLSMIRRAEDFDPREYALKKISELENAPKELTKEEKLEHLKQLIRENRYQVDYIKPKHRRADI